MSAYTDYTDVSGEVLVKEAAGGDAEAFAELYRRYRHVVVGYIARRAPEGSPVDDLASDAFVAALERIGDYETDCKDGCNVAQWLCRWAAAKLTEYRRAWWREQRALAAETDALALALRGEAAETVTSATLSPDLRAQLEELPPHYRRAIELLYLEGLTPAATAAVLGCSDSTAWRRVQGAMVALKRRAGVAYEVPRAAAAGAAHCRAVGDRTRTRIADHLAAQPDASTGQIAAALGLSRATVLRHRTTLRAMTAA